jgi:hypothetical protein
LDIIGYNISISFCKISIRDIMVRQEKSLYQIY